jgi:hypothetical protein
MHVIPGFTLTDDARSDDLWKRSAHEVASIMTIGGSIALLVIGAILRFAITWKPANVNLQVIGVILMIAGGLGLIISIAFLATRRRRRVAAEVYEERRYTEPPR